MVGLCLMLLSILRAQPMTKLNIRQSMRRVADWQIAHMNKVPHDPLNWVNATFYLGLSRWADLAEKENQDQI